MDDSTFMGLMMDTDEYLVDDCESEESMDHQNTKDSGSGSGSGFGLVPENEKQMKVNTTSSSSSSSGSLTSQLISFGSQDQKSKVIETSLNFSNQVTKDCDNNGRKREPRILKEHVLAERKRRQKLNERLIALSALLPGLKKTDKATILEDAIKHLKQLQQRVKKLEEERLEANKMDQSVILVKRSQVYVDNDSSTCSAALDVVSILKQSLPIIEARVSERDLLIKVHCDKKKGCLINILTSLEKFRLDVVNSFTLPFGSSTLVITVLTKMNNFSRPVEEVVNNIRLALAE